MYGKRARDTTRERETQPESPARYSRSGLFGVGVDGTAARRTKSRVGVRGRLLLLFALGPWPRGLVVLVDYGRCVGFGRPQDRGADRTDLPDVRGAGRRAEAARMSPLPPPPPLTPRCSTTAASLLPPLYIPNHVHCAAWL